MKKHAIIAVSILLATLLAPSFGHAGGNLAPNPSFEESVLEPHPALQGTQPQPVLPTGWAFEGAAGLFDHSPHWKTHGSRSAAISIPASTKRELCGPEVGCNDNPINPVRDGIQDHYRVTPHWRTALPIPVTGGTNYFFSVEVKVSIATIGEGATASVRWVDANGVTIRENGLAERRRKDLDPDDFTAQLKRNSIKAPNAAAGAYLLLGHTDDSWISQVLFDEVVFRTA